MNKLTCSFEKTFQQCLKSTLLLWIVPLLLICTCSVPQYDHVTLDFREDGTLKREQKQHCWPEPMLKRNTKLESFRAMKTLNPREVICKKEFETLEKLTSYDTAGMNISLKDALYYLRYADTSFISNNHKLLFIRNLAKTVLTSEDSHVLESQEEIQLKNGTLCRFIIASLECLCKNSRIPFYIHYEENMVIIYITEDITNINCIPIEDTENRTITSVHLHISLSFLHFLMKDTWSIYKSAKIFRAIYESNEIKKRTVDFDHAEYNSPFWCYEDLFKNATIDIFKIRIDSRNERKIYISQDCLKRHLRVSNLHVYLKEHYNLKAENLTNSDVLNNLKISLESTSRFLTSDIRFSEYTLETCKILTLKNLYLNEKLYNLILKMRNLKTLNLYDCCLGENIKKILYKDKKVMKILNIIDFGSYNESLLIFSEHIKAHTSCSIESLSMATDNDKVNNILLGIFRNENIKRSLKVICIDTNLLTNELCHAIFECNILEDVKIYSLKCRENLTKIGKFSCIASLKNVHFRISSFFAKFDCSLFDDFKEVKNLKIDFQNDSNMHLWNKNPSLLEKITALKIACRPELPDDLEWINYTFNVIELSITSVCNNDLRYILKILEIQKFTNTLKKLELKFLGQRTLTNEISEVIKDYKNLEVLEWKIQNYNIDFSSLLLRNKWVRTLKSLGVNLHKDSNFFESLQEPLESLTTLRICIFEGFILNENKDAIKKCFPMLKKIEISVSYLKDYWRHMEEYLKNYLEHLERFVPTFCFVDVMYVVDIKSGLMNISTLARQTKSQVSRPSVIKFLGEHSSELNLLVFRE